MRLVGFRVQNFRSIIDTDWCSLSIDRVTALVGQNESGKTSILEALASFYENEVDEHSLRSDGSTPVVACSFQVSEDELTKILAPFLDTDELAAIVRANEHRIALAALWDPSEESYIYIIETPEITEFLGKLEIRRAEEEKSARALEAAEQDKLRASTTPMPAAVATGGTAPAAGVSAGVAVPSKPKSGPTPSLTKLATIPEPLTELALVTSVTQLLPQCVLFEERGSLLPNKIDVEALQGKMLDTEGYYGALNYLSIAKLDIDKLIMAELRMAENQLSNANKQITRDFQQFWNQTIGTSKKITLECDLKVYDSSTPDKVGKRYLVFWVSDGQDKLFPQQRSKGVIWFLSFYLQLKNSSLAAKETIYLLDEPGASLHAKAQSDVLRLIDDIKEKCEVIFTTHSPYLIEQETIYRLLAVQRTDEDKDASPTRVFNVQNLASASRETLSPIYTAMGINFSDQVVVQKKRNVILEELSAYFYIQGLWTLLGNTEIAFFLPATGADNIPALANLFLGWGLEYIVVLDDDAAGRNVYNSLKKTIYLDDEKRAKKGAYKIADCQGIEDIFSTSDFKRWILEDAALAYTSSNSEYMKKGGLSKIITAANFLVRVKKKKIKFADLEESTRLKMQSVATEITKRLN